jgi:hypothetical protein
MILLLHDNNNRVANPHEEDIRRTLRLARQQDYRAGTYAHQLYPRYGEQANRWFTTIDNNDLWDDDAGTEYIAPNPRTDSARHLDHLSTLLVFISEVAACTIVHGTNGPLLLIAFNNVRDDYQTITCQLRAINTTLYALQQFFREHHTTSKEQLVNLATCNAWLYERRNSTNPGRTTHLRLCYHSLRRLLDAAPRNAPHLVQAIANGQWTIYTGQHRSHAECTIYLRLLQLRARPTQRYVGVSKYSCPSCAIVRDRLNDTGELQVMTRLIEADRSWPDDIAHHNAAIEQWAPPADPRLIAINTNNRIGSCFIPPTASQLQCYKRTGRQGQTRPRSRSRSRR